MKAEIDFLRRLELPARTLMFILTIYYLLLIASRVFVGKIYINTMPQDLLALLDGFYRINSGQIIHRDFSTVLGLFSYALPSVFMSLGAGLIRSLNYSEAVYALVALFIYLYIQRTRLDLAAGFFLGVWIPLALLARMNFGEPFESITEAMQYNRHCDVFLVFLFLLFIPARKSNRKYLIIDGALYGAISALLFYSKISFGLVALGLLPIMLIRRRDNLTVIAVSMVAFVTIATLVEIVYGTHFAWLTDVRMAAASEGRDRLNRIFHTLRDNGLELLGLLFVPAFILLFSRKLTISLAYFCVYVGIASVLIVSESAQSYVLTLPIAFLFVALDALKGEPASAGSMSQIRTRYVLFLSALGSMALVIESYPLAMNIALSTYRAIYAVPWDGTNQILGAIVNDSSDDDRGNVKSAVIDRIDKMSKPDIFAFARASKSQSHWDNLSMREYANYLDTGISAARDGCENRARISTIDVTNPFPMLLGWPTGGGMIFAAAGYLFSEKGHLPNEVMFRNINCVMIPKLPVQILFRDTLLNVYWPFLSKSFQQSFESDMWTVFRRRER